MSAADIAYADLLRDILAHGDEREGRNGGTRSVFGRKLVFDLAAEFPLLTTKRLHVRSIVVELAWMLRGETNVRWLQERGVSIWNEWAGPDGELGPVYGAQWRGFDGWDQIAAVVASLRADPYGRRHVVSAWNVAELRLMALPPCHVLFQFYVTGDGRLDCQLYQRSADVFLGLPFNIASYALLTCMMAATVGLKPGRLHHVLGDAHVYFNHISQAREQLTREGVPGPALSLPDPFDLFEFDPAEVRFIGYRPAPAIAAEVAA